MDKEIARAALIFLSRSRLEAVEIDVFMQVRAALEKIGEVTAEPQQEMMAD